MVGKVLDRFGKWYASCEVPPYVYAGPRAALMPPDLVLSWLAKRSYGAYRMWDWWANATGGTLASTRTPIREDTAETYRFDERYVEEIRKNGVAPISNAFPKQWIDEVHGYIMELHQKAKQGLERRRGEKGPWTDDQVTWLDESGIRFDCYLEHERYRFYFPTQLEQTRNLPKWVGEYLRLPEARSIFQAYYGQGVVWGNPYLMGEVLCPGRRLENWHFDCARKGMKAFLYVNDVGEKQGPLRVLHGTQHADERMRFQRFRVCRSGLKEAYYDDRTNAEYDQRGTSVVAPAGTLLLFDTTTVHAGSLCSEGMRVTLINGFRPANSMRINPRVLPNLPPVPTGGR